jgi:hypothetical protein
VSDVKVVIVGQESERHVERVSGGEMDEEGAMFFV